MEKITYGYYEFNPFGRLVMAFSGKGVCWIGFAMQGRQGADGLKLMQQHFPTMQFMRDDENISKRLKQILSCWKKGGAVEESMLDLRGTEFQKKVWQALLTIPRGEVRTYGDIARAVGKSKAARAVGRAVGANPLSLLVPCHRVVCGDGKTGNYLWGAELKRQLLTFEGVAL